MTYRLRTQLFGIAAVIAVLDQVTKAIVVHQIPLYDEIVVIPRFFAISHVLNKGAAFSIFANGHSATAALAIFSAVVMVMITYLLWRTSVWSRASVALAMILGGAAGNFIDRVRLKAVVDFLAFDFGRYHWPDFNVADSAIVIGSILLALDALFGQHSRSTD